MNKKFSELQLDMGTSLLTGATGFASFIYVLSIPNILINAKSLVFILILVGISLSILVFINYILILSFVRKWKSAKDIIYYN